MIQMTYWHSLVLLYFALPSASLEVLVGVVFTTEFASQALRAATLAWSSDAYVDKVSAWSILVLHLLAVHLGGREYCKREFGLWPHQQRSSDLLKEQGSRARDNLGVTRERLLEQGVKEGSAGFS